MHRKRAWIHLALAALATAILAIGQPAVCDDDRCPNLGCNDDLPCPGASCGCVRRPHQPFGRCAPY